MVTEAFAKSKYVLKTLLPLSNVFDTNSVLTY